MTLPLCHISLNILGKSSCHQFQMQQPDQLSLSRSPWRSMAKPSPNGPKRKRWNTSRHTSDLLWILLSLPTHRRCQAKGHSWGYPCFLGEGLIYGHAETLNACGHEGNWLCNSWSDSCHSGWLPSVYATEKMPVKIPWQGWWIKKKWVSFILRWYPKSVEVSC